MDVVQYNDMLRVQSTTGRYVKQTCHFLPSNCGNLVVDARFLHSYSLGCKYDPNRKISWKALSLCVRGHKML
jgi:hypothetical protein